MKKSTTAIKFIDVFAGCGGLSLGLLAAGCSGVFAVEKSPLAFATLKHNLIDKKQHSFDWPTWLPQEAMTCEDLLSDYSDQLALLDGEVDLIVGGPPCQGFSTAGKRDPADPRNKMTEQYLKLVELIKPRFIIIENVSGFDMKFEGEEGLALLSGSTQKKSYAQYIANRLRKSGYQVASGLINCAEFGVPQDRHRYLMICERIEKNQPASNLFDDLKKTSILFRIKRGLPANAHVNARDAISDLETKGKPLVTSKDSVAPGFYELDYTPPRTLTAFQHLMRKDAEKTVPNSCRLARHKASTIEYFQQVQAICRPGYCLSMEERNTVGTRKHSTTVLNPIAPAPTVTTLPDDIIHYSEPRILTVRESARLQSFPDWFEFQGKYTTGGKQRKHECPRYTQVGNAVPPLLSEALGELLIKQVAALQPPLTPPSSNASPIRSKKS